ncbi:MAG: CvpA family protein [Planctomycetaceae bacterium]|jgi:uncharacterized membrane protein required for colicin V production|nr:CvpA family protein [Planctomycetaceae bacterium]
MSVFDLVIFAVLIAFAFRGWMTGMVAQIVSVGSLAVSWIVASRFAFLIAPSIPAEEPWNNIGAMIVLFIITFFAVRLAHQYLEKKIKDWNLAKWNRHLGGLLGLLKGLIVCMVLTFFGVMLSEPTREIVFKSKSGNYLTRLIEKTETFIPPDSCELLQQQFERFNAQINANSINGAETPADLSPEEKSLQKMRDLIPSGQEIQDFQEKTQANLGNLVSQGSSLLEHAKSLQQETKQAVSLLDAIGKWWTGSGKENKETKTDSTENAESTESTQNSITDSKTDTDKVTNTNTSPAVSLFSKPITVPPEQPVPPSNPHPQNAANLLTETIEKPLAILPASVNLSSVVSEEKTLFRRRLAENNQPTITEPLTNSASQSASTVSSTTLPSTLPSIMPEFSDIALSGSELPEVMAVPIPISCSTGLFRLRSSVVHSSDRLLNSSPTRVPATLFVSPKH